MTRENAKRVSAVRVAVMLLSCLPLAACSNEEPGTGGGPGGASSDAGGSSSGMDAQTPTTRAPEPCAQMGETRSCCDVGTQTCEGFEFPSWGPCLDADGATLTCTSTVDCTAMEFSTDPACQDAGPPVVDCTRMEFSMDPACQDAGPPVVDCTRMEFSMDPACLDAGIPACTSCGPGGECRPGAIRYCDSNVAEWTISTCEGSCTWGPCLEARAPDGCPQNSYSPEECCPPRDLCCQDNPGGPFIGNCSNTVCR